MCYATTASNLPFNSAIHLLPPHTFHPLVAFLPARNGQVEHINSVIVRLLLFASWSSGSVLLVVWWSLVVRSTLVDYYYYCYSQLFRFYFSISITQLRFSLPLTVAITVTTALCTRLLRNATKPPTVRWKLHNPTIEPYVAQCTIALTSASSEHTYTHTHTLVHPHKVKVRALTD